MESSRLYMWKNLVDDIQWPVVLGFAIFVPSDWLHPTTNFQSFFTHYIGGIDIDVPVRCNGSKVYLFSGVHSKHIIYLFFSNLP